MSLKNMFLDLTLITRTRLNDDKARSDLRTFLAMTRSCGIASVVIVDSEKRITVDDNGLTKAVSMNGHFGKAACLNLALSYARTEFVMYAEQGNALDLKAVLRALVVMRENRDVHYVLGRSPATRFAQTSYEITPGMIFSKWGSPHALFPVNPDSVVMRRLSAVSAGGYGAVPEFESTMLILRLSNAFTGLQGSCALFADEEPHADQDSLIDADGSHNVRLAEMCFEMCAEELRAGRFGSALTHGAKSTTTERCDSIGTAPTQDDGAAFV